MLAYIPYMDPMGYAICFISFSIGGPITEAAQLAALSAIGERGPGPLGRASSGAWDTLGIAIVTFLQRNKEENIETL